VVDDYLETIGVDLVEGRTLSASDDAAATHVVVVNESMARRHLGPNALGRRIAFGDPERTGWWTVVGVARDVRHFAVREGTAAGADPTATSDAPAAYLPYQQTLALFAPGTMSIAARVQGDPIALVPDVRRALADLDPALAASTIQPLAALVDNALARDRFVARLLAAFAATALLLAAIGIYGVVSYGVSQRVREMGIRRALGAENAEVTLLVVRGGLRLTAVGLVLGASGSLLVTRALRGLLYEVQPTDPTTFVVTALLLGAVAVLASWLPTRRLGRLDPVSVLRAE
jgi:hypothetical protein